MNNPINRRKFIRLSLLSGAGLAAPLSSSAAQQETTARKMNVRPLGKTGIKLPLLSLGALTATPNLVKAALKRGVVMIDTAHIYTEGRNEVMLGKVLKEFPRDSFVIATKIYTNRAALSPDFEARFERELTVSLERLQLESVDILYLQDITSREQVLHKPVMELVEKYRKAGKYKYVGIATHANEPEVINAVVDSGYYDVVLTAYNLRQKYILELNRAIERAREAGIGVVAMKVMAGGQSNASAAIKWALQNKGISTALMGCSTYDQLETDLQAALKPKLSKEERQYVENITQTESFYCQNCPGCSDRCQMKLGITHLMRIYMYCFGYKDPGLAKEFLNGMRLPNDVCSCKSCTVECISGFDVRARILKLQQLQKTPRDFVMFDKY